MRVFDFQASHTLPNPISTILYRPNRLTSHSSFPFNIDHDLPLVLMDQAEGGGISFVDDHALFSAAADERTQRNVLIGLKILVWKERERDRTAINADRGNVWPCSSFPSGWKAIRISFIIH